MEIRQIRYFVEIAERGSFSCAARALAVTQPALSRQISLLEESLSERLFYRNGRGVTINPAGEVFLAHARAVLKRLDCAQRDVSALRRVPQGEVTLGLPSSVSATLVRRLVVKLAEDCPRIKLHVEEGPGDNVIEALQAGKLDLGIVYDDRRNSGFATERLMIEQLVLVHSPALRLPPEILGAELVSLPLVLPARPNGLRLMIEHRLAEFGYAPNVRLEMNSLLTLKELAAAGVAATILPYGAVAREVAAGSLCAAALRNPSLRRDVMLATVQGRRLETAPLAVASALREVAAGEQAAGPNEGRHPPANYVVPSEGIALQ